MKIRILPEAESDLARAAGFYDAQRDAAGDYFIACLASDIEALKIHAGVHERQHELLRSLSKRFPFGIFYELTGERWKPWPRVYARQGQPGSRGERGVAKVDSRLNGCTLSGVHRRKPSRTCLPSTTNSARFLPSTWIGHGSKIGSFRSPFSMQSSRRSIRSPTATDGWDE